RPCPARARTTARGCCADAGEFSSRAGCCARSAARCAARPRSTTAPRRRRSRRSERLGQRRKRGASADSEIRRSRGSIFREIYHFMLPNDLVFSPKSAESDITSQAEGAGDDLEEPPL